MYPNYAFTHKIKMRVEIKGQFNIDWVGSSFNSEKVEVSRDGIQTMSLPSNFESFCSEVNIKLMKVQKAKKFQQIFGTLAWLCLIGFVVVSNILARKLYTNGNVFIPMFIYIPCFGLFIFQYFYVRNMVRSGFDDVSSLCATFSVNGSRYMLENEHWGGCNKPHVRRYFISVNNDDEEQAMPIAAPVVVPADNTNYNNPYLQSSATENKPSSSGDQPVSIFDQLNK